MQTLSATLDKVDSSLWSYHIKVDDHIAESFNESNRKVVCTINASVSYNAAITSFHGSWMILINKRNRTLLKVQQGEPLLIQLVADNSTYGMPMPVEFEPVMGQKEEAFELFKKLTLGK
jgi:hypothetical protein